MLIECSKHVIAHAGEVPAVELFDAAVTALQGTGSEQDGALVPVLRCWGELCADESGQPPELPELADIPLRTVIADRKRRAGQIEEAFVELQRLAEHSGNYPAADVAFARTHFAIALFYAGRWEESHQISREIAERYVEYGESPQALMAYAAAALVPSARGEDTAQALLSHVSSATGGLCSAGVNGTAGFAKSWAHLSQGDRDSAQSYVQTLRLGAFPWKVTGLLPAALFAPAVAAGRGRDVLPDLLALVETSAVPCTPALRDYITAHLRAMITEDPAARLEQLFTTLDCLDRVAPPGTLAGTGHGGLFIMRALLIATIGEVCAAHPGALRSPPLDVGLLLAWAEDILESCGAASLAGHVRELLVSTHESAGSLLTPAASPMSRPATAVALLSPREREMAGLIARGLKNRQIAEELYLSVRTVETHVRNILLKLELPNRRELHRYLSQLSRVPPAAAREPLSAVVAEPSQPRDARLSPESDPGSG